MKLRSKLRAALSVSLLLHSGTSFAEGNAERGKSLYGICATCHGQQAEGTQEMNAPALAGREKWYIIRQLQNFKSGVRGTNPKDIYGMQMAPMAQLLADAQAIEDMATYLNSLKD